MVLMGKPVHATEAQRARYQQELATLDARMELPRNNMQKYFSDKADVVRFASKALRNLATGSTLTMTIEREKFADYYVTMTTTASSVETAGNTPTNTKGLDVT